MCGDSSQTWPVTPGIRQSGTVFRVKPPASARRSHSWGPSQPLMWCDASLLPDRACKSVCLRAGGLPRALRLQFLRWVWPVKYCSLANGLPQGCRRATQARTSLMRSRSRKHHGGGRGARRKRTEVSRPLAPPPSLSRPKGREGERELERERKGREEREREREKCSRSDSRSVSTTPCRVTTPLGARAQHKFSDCSCDRKRVLFIGTQYSNLYTEVDTPAEAAW